MGKFQVGDTVRIRTDLVPNREYHSEDDGAGVGGCVFVDAMVEFCGLSAEVTEVFNVDWSSVGARYYLDGPPGVSEWWWSDDMLEHEVFEDFIPNEQDIMELIGGST